MEYAAVCLFHVQNCQNTCKHLSSKTQRNREIVATFLTFLATQKIFAFNLQAMREPLTFTLKSDVVTTRTRSVFEPCSTQKNEDKLIVVALQAKV